MTLGGVTSDPVMNYTHGTTPTPLHVQQVEPESCTSTLRADARDSSSSNSSSAAYTELSSHQKKPNPGPFTVEQRQVLIDRIVDVAHAHQRDEWAWDEMNNLWEQIDEYLSDDLMDKDILRDLIENGKWTISAKCIDRYEAGTELNKMINTAQLGHLTPADNNAA